MEAARRGEDVDAGGLARRLERLTLADLRAIRAKVGGAAGGRSKGDLSGRILAALTPAPAVSGKHNPVVDEHAASRDALERARRLHELPASGKVKSQTALDLSSLPPGTPTPVGELRVRSGLSKAEFDAAVLAAADRGEVSLHRHNAASQLSPRDRDQLVADPNGEDYYGYVTPAEKPRADDTGDVEIPEHPTDAYALTDAQRVKVAGRLGLPAGADARTVALAIADRQEREGPPVQARPDAPGQRAFDWDAVAAGKRGARKGTVVRPPHSTTPPPPEPSPPPEQPEDPATVRRREREQWTGQLDRIGVGDSGYVGGVFVRRTGPSEWRTETERGFVQGDAERLLQHVASVRQDAGLYGRQLKEALARFRNAPRNTAPGGGSLFGGDDLQAQRGFTRLPQGAAVAITEGGYKGRVGRIVREEVAPGRYRILVRPEGSSEAIPIHHSSVEPLDPKYSWRVDRSGDPPPTRQSKLFSRRDGDAIL